MLSELQSFLSIKSTRASFEYHEVDIWFDEAGGELLSKEPSTRASVAFSVA